MKYIFFFLLIIFSLYKCNWENSFNSPSSIKPLARDKFSISLNLEQNLILFGGTKGGLHNESYNSIYQFDFISKNWTLIPATGNIPSNRGDHSAVITNQNEMFVFGGIRNTTLFNEIYKFSFNTSTWSNLIPTGDIPSKRFSHSAVLTSKNEMIIFGGKGEENKCNISLNQFCFDLNDIYIYQISSNNWVKLNPTGDIPISRGEHSAIITPEDEIIIFGGASYLIDQFTPIPTFYNDIYKFSNDTWIQINSSGISPFPRREHSAVLTNNYLMIIFGGFSTLSGPDIIILNDINVYDILKNEWKNTYFPCGNPPYEKYSSYGFLKDRNVLYALLDGWFFFKNDLTELVPIECGPDNCEPKKWDYGSGNAAWTIILLIVMIIVLIVISFFIHKRLSYVNPIFSEENQTQPSTEIPQVILQSIDVGYQKRLSKVSFVLKPGSLVAVIGPSGCGKSSLYDLLLGKHQHEGKIKAQIVGSNKEITVTELQNYVSFVPQNDILPPHLTIGEIFKYNIKLLNKKSTISFDNQIGNILHYLGLDENKTNPMYKRFINQVSGGQRKRVSIGSELLSYRSIMLLDEPTSGLDSEVAENILKTLKELTVKLNLAMMVTIHTPTKAMFDNFTHLLILIDNPNGGYSYCFGPPEKVFPEIKELQDPCSSILNEIKKIKVGSSTKLVKYNEANELKDEKWTPTVKDKFIVHIMKRILRSITAFLKLGPIQFLIFFRRALLQFYLRQGKVLFVDLGLLLSSFLIIFLMYGNLPQFNPKILPTWNPLIQVSNLSIITAALLAVTGSQRLFGLDKDAWDREARIGHSTISFFFAKDFIHVLWILFESITIILCCYAWIQQDFFKILLSVFGVMYVSSGIGYFSSIIVPLPISIVASVIFVFICSLFAGINPPQNLLHDLSPALWSLFSIFAFPRFGIQLMYFVLIQPFKSLYPDEIEQTMQALGFKENYAKPFIFLLLYGLFFRFLALCCLKNLTAQTIKEEKPNTRQLITASFMKRAERRNKPLPNPPNKLEEGKNNLEE